MRSAGLALLSALLAVTAGAADATCRLALVLALDVSSSVDPIEDRQQRIGLAGALRDPQVQAAFMASPDPVALYAFEWSGKFDQVPLLPDWMMIASTRDLDQAAGLIASSPRSREDMPTALGSALGHAVTMLRRGPNCLFRTIDVSADGPNNESFGPQSAYDAFPFEDVTVNALVIPSPGDNSIVRYYRDHVIRGPGSFVEIAQGYSDDGPAMRRKLLAELSVQMLGSVQREGTLPG